MHAIEVMMKLGTKKCEEQHREEKSILHDLVYSQNFFLNLLTKALKHDHIRSVQWSFDGRCVCLDKKQSLLEFERYLKLPRLSVSLECYNRLVLRLLENQFQLASYSNGFQNQVRCIKLYCTVVC